MILTIILLILFVPAIVVLIIGGFILLWCCEALYQLTTITWSTLKTATWEDIKYNFRFPIKDLGQ